PNPLAIHRHSSTASTAVSPADQASARQATLSARDRRTWPGRVRRRTALTATLSRATRGVRAARPAAMTTTSGASTRRRISRGGSIGVSEWRSAPAGNLGQVASRRRVRAVDTATYLVLAAITELAKPRRKPVAAGGQDVHLDACRDC